MCVYVHNKKLQKIVESDIFLNPNTIKQRSDFFNSSII